MRIFNYLFLILACLPIYAQESAPIKKEDVINTFKSLTVAKSDDFPSEFKKSLSLADAFIEQQKQQCSSKFSVVEIEEGGEVKRVEKPLTAEERALCYRELKLVQKEVIDLSFDSRRSYAVKIHESFLISLDLERTRAKEALDKAYDKKRRRSKRSRPRSRKN